MSLNMPSRRALGKASNGLRSTSVAPCIAAASIQSHALAHRPRIEQQSSVVSTRPLHTSASRNVDWGRLFGRRKKAASAKSGGAAADGLAGDLGRAETRQQLRERLTNPDLGASPLLASEMEEGGVDEKDLKKKPSAAAESGRKNELGASLLRPDLRRALDPDPRSRVRWERKMVLRHVGKLLDPQGAESRDERLARTERSLLHKSTPWATSTKKLGFLARQIAGKTVEDALVQMRFSKKKFAKEVLWHLEEARDLAVVERGMGLGRVQQRQQQQQLAGEGEGRGDGGDGAAPPAPIKIQTKDGKFLTVTDPTRIYVDEAWVTKGAYLAATPDYRARGRRFIMWKPSTFLSVVLKEEKTRIRQHEEREAKAAKKAPWVHLPNRPVTAQRPYYSW